MTPSSIRTTTAAALFVAFAVLAGCTSTPDPAPSAAATGPLSPSEHSALEIRTVAACLVEQGWKVEVTAEGGMQADLPTDQQAAFETANEQCRTDFLAAHPRPGLDEDDLVTLYRHQLVLVDCLKAKGYPPVQEAPSQQEYVAEGLAGKTPEFYAWSAVGSPTADELTELQRDCPQDPPGM